MWSVSFPPDAAEWARTKGVCIPLWLQFDIRGYKSPKDTSIKPQRVQIETNRCSDNAYEYCFVYALFTFGAATGIHAMYEANKLTKSFIPMFPRYVEGIGAVDYRRTASVLWMKTQLNKLFSNSTLRAKFAAIGVLSKWRPHSFKAVAMSWALRSKLDWPVAKMNMRFIGSNDSHADKYAQRASHGLVQDAQGRVQDPLYRFWRMTPHVTTYDVPRSVPVGIDVSDDEDELEPVARARKRQRVSPASDSGSDSESDAGDGDDLSD
jgi:hypothetical protein